MKILLLLACLVIMVGCSKKAPPKGIESPPSYTEVNNNATRYVENLQRNLETAKNTAEKANQKTAEYEENMRKFNQAYQGNTE
jgi:hypothetical protein